VEAFCDAPLEVCEERDPKGLYRRARALDVAEFTGVSSPYERPRSPELVIDTARLSVTESVDAVMAYLCARGLV
jgi:adenylylsulfate kinase